MRELRREDESSHTYTLPLDEIDRSVVLSSVSFPHLDAVVEDHVRHHGQHPRGQNGIDAITPSPRDVVDNPPVRQCRQRRQQRQHHQQQ